MYLNYKLRLKFLTNLKVFFSRCNFTRIVNEKKSASVILKLKHEEAICESYELRFNLLTKHQKKIFFICFAVLIIFKKKTGKFIRAIYKIDGTAI